MDSSLRDRLMTKRNRFRRHLGPGLLDALKAMGVAAAVFVISASMVYAYSFIITLPYFRVRETVVRGCKELTEKDIMSLVNQKPARNLLAANTEAIRVRVKQNPWVRSVYVGRELPDRLVVQIHERTAVAIIKQREEMFLLDGEGVAFKRRDHVDDADMPVLTGFYKDGALDRVLLGKSLALLKQLEKWPNFPTINMVSEIHGDEVRGFSVYTDTGICLQMGFDSFENKLKRLAPVLADLEMKNLKSSYLDIDLSDPAKIVVKRSNIMGPQETIEQEKNAKNNYRT